MGRGFGTDTQPGEVADKRDRDTLVVAIRRVRVRIAPGSSDQSSGAAGATPCAGPELTRTGWSFRDDEASSSTPETRTEPC
jgi:hypothetical protein